MAGRLEDMYKGQVTGWCDACEGRMPAGTLGFVLLYFVPK